MVGPIVPTWRGAVVGDGQDYGIPQDSQGDEMLRMGGADVSRRRRHSSLDGSSCRIM